METAFSPVEETAASTPVVTPTERVVNGDFSSATGWTQGTGWVIAAGVVTGTAASEPLDNMLSSSISIGTTVNYSFSIVSNTGGDSLSFQLFNSGSGLAQNIATSASEGTISGSIIADLHGPFDLLRITDDDSANIVVIDDASLIA